MSIAAEVAGILPFFALFFGSNAIVPVATMPGWLQGFARNQPVSVTITAVRALFQGRGRFVPPPALLLRIAELLE